MKIIFKIFFLFFFVKSGFSQNTNSDTLLTKPQTINVTKINDPKMYLIGARLFYNGQDLNYKKYKETLEGYQNATIKATLLKNYNEENDLRGRGIKKFWGVMARTSISIAIATLVSENLEDEVSLNPQTGMYSVNKNIQAKNTIIQAALYGGFVVAPAFMGFRYSHTLKKRSNKIRKINVDLFNEHLPK